MASILPAIASFFNPANVIRGIGNTVTGVLDSISAGRGLDLATNLSKGIKTAIGSDNPSPPNVGKSIIGSTGGNYAYEGNDNQASNVANQRIAKLNTMITPKYNATSLRPVYTDKYGRGGVYSSYPDGQVDKINDVSYKLPTAPAGMPSFELTNVDVLPQRKGTGKDSELVLRDINGYKGVQQGIKRMKINKKRGGNNKKRR